MGAEIVQVLLKLLEIQLLDICMLVKWLDIAECMELSYRCYNRNDFMRMKPILGLNIQLFFATIYEGGKGKFATVQWPIY